MLLPRHGLKAGDDNHFLGLSFNDLSDLALRLYDGEEDEEPLLNPIQDAC